MARIIRDTSRSHAGTPAPENEGIRPGHARAEIRPLPRLARIAAAISIVAVLAISAVALGSSTTPQVIADGPPRRVAQILPTEAACWQAVRKAGHQFGVTAGCRFAEGRGWLFEIW